jgi:MFS family permease
MSDSVQPDDGRMDLRGRPLVTLTAMLLLAFAAAIAMPFNISGIVQSFAASNTLAGLVATVEMGCIAASSLVFAQLASRLSPRAIYTAGICLILAMNGLTVLVVQVETLVIVRGLAGFGAGAVAATVMATAGRSRTPEKTFGVINSFVGVMGIIMAQVLPQALKLGTVTDPAWGVREADGLFVVYAVASIIALILIRLVPVPPRRAAAGSAAGSAVRLPAGGWLALAGMGVIFFGHGTLSMYIVEVGLEAGLTAQGIGNTFAVASLIGIVAPLIAGHVGSRFRAALPVYVILAAVLLFGLLLSHVTTPAGFMVFAPLYAMTPIAMMPIALGALARLDPSGRLTGAHPAFVTLGGALAPLTGGAIRDFAGDFTLTGWFVAACIVTGGALMYRAIALADRLRGTAPAVPAQA